MSFGDSLRVAIEALIANKMRACLTMLGIIIGVGAVIALMAVGQGSQKAVTDRIQGLGSNLIFVRPGVAANTGAGARTGNGSAQTLSAEDATAILTTVSGVLNASPQVNSAVQVIAGGSNTFTRVAGVTPDFASTLSLVVADGSFITDDDITRNARVAVLGANVAQNLFPDGGAVGQSMRVSVGPQVLTMTITGVLKSQGGNSQSSNDDQLFVPITTAQRSISFMRGANAQNLVSQITVQVTDKKQIEPAKLAITNLLLDRHKVVQADFTVESQEDLQAAAQQVSQTMTVLLGSIAGISLIVGGIGIMNIMLVSVTERTREIGIRKAVGARQADILMQFLTEALTVTMLGGLLGITAGLSAAYFMNGQNISGLGDNVQTVISWSSVGVAFVVSVLIGLFFGIYPAQRAARMKPIEALRYE